MKRNDEREELLADVLANEAELRNATLEAGLQEVGRVCRRRRAMRAVTIGAMPVVISAAIICVREMLSNGEKPGDLSLHIARADELIPGTPIRVVNDEQLLELFQGQAVALVGQPGHQQLLLFDERN